MANKPLISVIMSIYNEEKYIAEALNSILNQTEQSFEIIIVNDCSTDNTAQIVRDINDPRIIMIDNETNQGLTKNLNKALEYAQGKYIARMDGDDISLPTRFETQVRFLEEYPEIWLISCNNTTFGQKALVSDIGGTPEELRCKMLLRPQLAHPGFMMRAELIREHGFRYDEHFRSAQDYDFATRVAREYKLAVTPEILLQYRAHEGQVSQTPNMKQLGFADEIRTRLLGELGVVLTEEEMNAYRCWAMETPIDKNGYLLNVNIIKCICDANDACKKMYEPQVLKATLWKQYFTWMLRVHGVKYACVVCGINPARYMCLIMTGIRMVRSKRRRAEIKEL